MVLESCFQQANPQGVGGLSTGERPFLDILQDRRYWVIHIVTIPALFAAGAIFVISGFVFKVFRSPVFTAGSSENALIFRPSINILNDRFSALSELETA